MVLNKPLCAALMAATFALPTLASTNLKPINNANYALPDTQDWQEADYTVPDYPTAPVWIGFFVPLKPDFKYFVDAQSLSLGSDGVLHYVLRAVSASGAESLSVEGLQCENHSLRAYAFGDTINKQWISSTRALWKRLNDEDGLHMRLANDVCPDWNTPASVADVVSSIKKSPWY
jgi:hypothetical protein